MNGCMLVDMTTGASIFALHLQPAFGLSGVSRESAESGIAALAYSVILSALEWPADESVRPATIAWLSPDFSLATLLEPNMVCNKGVPELSETFLNSAFAAPNVSPVHSFLVPHHHSCCKAIGARDITISFALHPLLPVLSASFSSREQPKVGDIVAMGQLRQFIACRAANYFSTRNRKVFRGKELFRCILLERVYREALHQWCEMALQSSQLFSLIKCSVLVVCSTAIAPANGMTTVSSTWRVTTVKEHQHKELLRRVCFSYRSGTAEVCELLDPSAALDLLQCCVAMGDVHVPIASRGQSTAPSFQAVGNLQIGMFPIPGGAVYVAAESPVQSVARAVAKCGKNWELFVRSACTSFAEALGVT